MTNPEPGYFSAEMARYRALDMAIRNGEESPDQVVERATKYATFLNGSD